jgi:heptosyltransferase-2
MKNPKNIIVRMPNWLGDLVMGTPVLADLRKKYPNAHITAMCQKNVASLLKEDPHIDDIFSFTPPKNLLNFPSQKELVEKLKKEQYDTGILLSNSFSSAWWLWRGQVKNRIGFTGDWRSWLMSTPLSFPKNLNKQHLVKTYKALLKPLGIPISERPPRLYLSDKEIEDAKEILHRHGVRDGHTIIGINPGAAYGSAKCWIPSRFKEVTQQLLENPTNRIVYFGDSVGAKLTQEICLGMSDRVINLAGKTSIRELLALISLCSTFLTNDSGPMHIASALGTPHVAIFGSTSDVKTGPYSHGRVIHKHVSCSPCYKRECPIDFRCMTSIHADEVFHEMENLIKLPRS